MTEITIRLEDSRLTPTVASEWWDRGSSAHVLRAVELLGADIDDGYVECCSFNGRKCECVHDQLIGATVLASENLHTKQSKITEVGFTTGHYVGQACVSVNDRLIRFRIEPRMARPIWRYLLKCAACVYLPERLQSRGIDADDDNAEWLLLLMWRNAFERAMKLVSVPKAYVLRRQNLRCFKGRLDVARHLKANLTDQSRFYCAFKPLTFDNTINRTIRMVYRVLSNSALPAKSYLSIAEHDARLASFGVGNEGVTLRDIDAINYTRQTEPYRSVMNLSKVLLRGYGAGEVEGGGKGPAYFVDVAEVWENYLLSILKRHIPEYRFESPNDLNRSEWLLEGARRVRPDFMVYDKVGRLVAVMDAKYKHVDRIGRTGADPNAVSREDLYQMATYLYRYGDPGQKIAGIFLTPFSVHGEQRPIPMAWNDRTELHYMTVCGMPLQVLDEKYCADSTKAKVDTRTVEKDLKETEVHYCCRLKEILDGISGRAKL